MKYMVLFQYNNVYKEKSNIYLMNESDTDNRPETCYYRLIELAMSDSFIRNSDCYGRADCGPDCPDYLRASEGKKIFSHSNGSDWAWKVETHMSKKNSAGKTYDGHFYDSQTLNAMNAFIDFKDPYEIITELEERGDDINEQLEELVEATTQVFFE